MPAMAIRNRLGLHDSWLRMDLANVLNTSRRRQQPSSNSQLWRYGVTSCMVLGGRIICPRASHENHKVEVSLMTSPGWRVESSPESSHIKKRLHAVGTGIGVKSPSPDLIKKALSASEAAHDRKGREIFLMHVFSTGCRTVAKELVEAMICRQPPVGLNVTPGWRRWQESECRQILGDGKPRLRNGGASAGWLVPRENADPLVRPL